MKELGRMIQDVVEQYLMEAQEEEVRKGSEEE